jgi:hypothetical protein
MSATLHDLDFYTWTQRQAELLREGRFDELDTGHRNISPSGAGIAGGAPSRSSASISMSCWPRIRA